MSYGFRVTVHFLQPYSHGRGEDGTPEWPPSPLRLFQALVAAAVGRQPDDEARQRTIAALRWLERQGPPEIVAPTVGRVTEPYRLYVPDNVADKVAKSWVAGRKAELAEYRTEKDVRALRLEGDSVHYLFRPVEEAELHIPTLRAAARAMTHLGWGVDMVVGDVQEGDEVTGEHWLPGRHGGRSLRCPKGGTFDALERKHAQFLRRLDGDAFRPVSPLNAYDVHPYARATDPVPRPFAAYRLLEPLTCDRVSLDPTRRARDVAAWTRHAVAEAAEGWPFGPTSELVHGHGAVGPEARMRFSFLPLPTITPQRVDGIARVIVVGSPGLEREMDWLRPHLAGQDLVWDGKAVAFLDPLPAGDWVLNRYCGSGECWSTVTPVVLPGHDDRSSRKAESLIRKAFIQAGFPHEVVNAIRELEWRNVGFRPGLDLASRYLPPDKISGPMFHLRVRFASAVAGPVAVGSGRHRGMGVFALE